MKKYSSIIFVLLTTCGILLLYFNKVLFEDFWVKRILTYDDLVKNYIITSPTQMIKVRYLSIAPGLILLMAGLFPVFKKTINMLKGRELKLETEPKP